MNTLNKWQHWPAFWQLVREHNVCPESDKERLGECEIVLRFLAYDSDNFMNLCTWHLSGFAGDVMKELGRKFPDLCNLDLSTYTPTKTAPLPIVKPCHRCDMEHDEAYPTEACKRLLDAEGDKEKLTARIKELELDNGLVKLCIEQAKTNNESAEAYIAELDARFLRLKRQYEELFKCALFYSRHSGELYALKEKHISQNESTNDATTPIEEPHA